VGLLLLGGEDVGLVWSKCDAGEAKFLKFSLPRLREGVREGMAMQHKGCVGALAVGWVGREGLPLTGWNELSTGSREIRGGEAMR